MRRRRVRRRRIRRGRKRSSAYKTRKSFRRRGRRSRPSYQMTAWPDQLKWSHKWDATAVVAATQNGILSQVGYYRANSLFDPNFAMGVQ